MSTLLALNIQTKGQITHRTRATNEVLSVAKSSSKCQHVNSSFSWNRTNTWCKYDIATDKGKSLFAAVNAHMWSTQQSIIGPQTRHRIK